MDHFEVVIRLVLAIVIGGLVGYEREFKNRPAGFRTHILVCVGAAVTSMVQLSAVQETTDMILKNPQLAAALKSDIGRLGAQVITGVGFLGAGTIIHEKGSVRGLTTAASIWVVACIGLAVGLGYYFLSISALIGVVMVLVFFKRFETKFFEQANILKLEIEYVNKKEFVGKIEEYLNSKNIKIKNIEFTLEESEESVMCTNGLYTLLVPRHIRYNNIIQELGGYTEIIHVKRIMDI